jgi:hypothetical protein
MTTGKAPWKPPDDVLDTSRDRHYLRWLGRDARTYEELCRWGSPKVDTWPASTRTSTPSSAPSPASVDGSSTSTPN